MAEMTMKQVREMGDAQIASILRVAASCEREHTAITFEHGTLLVNICAYHGDKIADRLSHHPQSSPLDLVEPEDADVLIKALKAYRPWDANEESTVLYYIAQLQKVAADKEDAA